MKNSRSFSVVSGLTLVLGIALGAGACGDANQGSSFADGGNGGNAQPGPAGGSLGGDQGTSDPVFDTGDAGGGGGTAEDAGCASAEAKATPSPVYMLFVLDASGSMVENQDGSPNKKWEAASSALRSFFDDLKAKQDTSIGVGLLVFQGSGTRFPRTGDVMDTKMVDDAQWQKLTTRVSGITPEGGTPTEYALGATYDAMQAFKTAPSGPNDTGFAQSWQRSYGNLQPGGKKVVVLASDGVPSSLNGKQASEQLASTNLKTNSILTFSIGIGPFPGDSYYDPAFMGRIAVAGGTAPAACQADTTDVKKVCHFQITPGGDAKKIAADLLTAINTIRKAAASCEYNLSASEGGSIDPLKVNVQVKDGAGKPTTIPKDPKDGWTYDNDVAPTKVILHGASCDRVRNDDKSTVKVVLGCRTYIP